MSDLCRSLRPWGNMRTSLIANTLHVTSDGQPVYAFAQTPPTDGEPKGETTFGVQVGRRVVWPSFTGVRTSFFLSDDVPLIHFHSLRRQSEFAEPEVVECVADPVDGNTLRTVGGGPTTKYHHYVFGDWFVSREQWEAARQRHARQVTELDVTIRDIEYVMMVRESSASKTHVKLILQPRNQQHPTYDYDSNFAGIVIVEPKRCNTARFYCARVESADEIVFVEVEVHPPDEIRGDSIPPPPPP